MNEPAAQNGYVCFYNSKRWECYAPTVFAAVEKAREHFKPPKSKRHLVSAMLAEKNGQQVTHTAVD